MPPPTGLPVANTSYKAEQNGVQNGSGAAVDAASEGHGGDEHADHIAAGAEHETVLETETVEAETLNG
jgi:hypothetical protein